MNKLSVIEHNEQRVLTTVQLVELYNTDANNIQKNYSRNSERFIPTIHFFKLEGSNLREFKETSNCQVASNINVLYLWTEKGALLHAKSLNTDEAWDVYNQLVDTYFRAKELKSSQLDVSKLPKELQMFNQLFNSLAQAHLETQRLTEEVNTVKESFSQVKTLLADREENWREWINKMFNSVARKCGNKFEDLRAESYRVLEQRAKCDLAARVRNMRERLEESGATKTKINGVTKLEVIESEPRLKEIYTSVIKELSIKWNN